MFQYPLSFRIRIPSSYNLILVQIKSLQYFGVQTFVELLCRHKRQIPGVGRNVYVWQLNAVLPTTGLILHPWGDWTFGGARKGKRSKWQEPGSMFITPSRRTFSWCPMMMLHPPTSRYSPKSFICTEFAFIYNWTRQKYLSILQSRRRICSEYAVAPLRFGAKQFVPNFLGVNTFRSKTLGQTTWIKNQQNWAPEKFQWKVWGHISKA